MDDGKYECPVGSYLNGDKCTSKLENFAVKYFNKMVVILLQALWNAKHVKMDILFLKKINYVSQYALERSENECSLCDPGTYYEDSACKSKRKIKI